MMAHDNFMYASRNAQPKTKFKQEVGCSVDHELTSRNSSRSLHLGHGRRRANSKDALQQAVFATVRSSIAESDGIAALSRTH
jgi:hypothetical protein